MGDNSKMNTQISCPVCLHPHFASVESLRNTLISVATSALTCPVCQDTLIGLDKLTIHLFTHIGAATAAASVSAQAEVSNCVDLEINNVQVQMQAAPHEQFKCDICNFSFNDGNLLEMHQKLLHQTTEDQQTGLYSYHCHLCSKKFKMKGSLMVHLRVAHYGFSHKEKAPESAKKWACDVCHKMFTTKYFLKKHKRLHTGEQPYYCENCNKSFTFQQSYRKHMLYHSSEKPHVCSQCGRAFKELSTLHNHERIHSGEKPFACETCGKCFRQRVSYLVHRRIHTGAMPYKCTTCGKSFRYKVSQRSHNCTVPEASFTFDGVNLIPQTTTTACTSNFANSVIPEVANLKIDDQLQTINQESLKEMLFSNGDAA